MSNTRFSPRKESSFDDQVKWEINKYWTSVSMKFDYASFCAVVNKFWIPDLADCFGLLSILWCNKNTTIHSVIIGQPKITKIKICLFFANAKNPKPNQTNKWTNKQITKTELPPHCLWRVWLWSWLLFSSMCHIHIGVLVDCWESKNWGVEWRNPRVRLIQVSDLMEFYPRLSW